MISQLLYNNNNIVVAAFVHVIIILRIHNEETGQDNPITIILLCYNNNITAQDYYYNTVTKSYPKNVQLVKTGQYHNRCSHEVDRLAFVAAQIVLHLIPQHFLVWVHLH